jgi:DNA/RNA endonuclease YhcR with UshA esterase domain
MKTLRKSILFLLSIFLVFSACDEREFDTPPLDAPIYKGEANITIQKLKDLYAGKTLVEIDTALIIRGIVTANDVSGNIYKQIQLEDETAGICIAIDRNNIYGDFRVGQEVFVELKGLYFGLYGNYPQIGYKYSRNNDNNYSIGQATWEFFKERAYLNGWPTPDKVVPKEFADIKDISSTDIGKLITIRNVYFEKGGQEPFAVPNPATGGVQTESKILKSATSTSTLTARNSSAANFAAFTMPEGVGTITGVLSIYNTTLQITLRDSLDYSFGSGEGIGTKDLPWQIPYTLENQTNNLNGWIDGYIVGAVAPVFNDVNPIKGNDGISFAAPFLNNTVIIAESADVKDWTKVVVVNLPSGSDIRSKVNLTDNPSNLGLKLKVTGDLKNQLGAAGLAVDKGTSAEFVLSAPAIGGGDGSKDSPYSVAQAQSNQGATGWVKGFIVGAVKTGDKAFIESNDDVVFGTAGIRSTAVLIADSKDEKDYAKCVVVKLNDAADVNPSDLRSKVNLVDNPGNLLKELKVTGKLANYFAIPGVRDITAFEIEAGSTPPSSAILDETLLTQASFNKFTSYSVSGSQEWTFSSQYGAVMTGFSDADGTSYANEDWFISPAIDLLGKTSAKLSFDHARGPAGSITIGIAEGYYTVWVSNNYSSGNPTSATWTELTGVSHGTSAWGYVSSGELNIPAANLAANAKIAFKYKSISGASATWEVKNVKVSDGTSTGGGGGGTDPGTGTGTGSSSGDPYSVAQGITNQGGSGQTWTKGYIVGAVNNGVTSVTGSSDYKIGVSSGWDSQTNVIIADSPTETNIDKCIIVNLPSGKPLRTQVNLSNNPGNYKKTLTVKGVLRTYFGKAGIRDSAGESTDFILQ